MIASGGVRYGELVVFAVSKGTGRSMFHKPVQQQLPLTNEAERVRKAFSPAFAHPYGEKK